MKFKGHKLPIVIFIFCIIIMLGFRDTGIFIKDYKITENNNQIIIDKGEDVDVLKETDDSFFITSKDMYYQVPKDALIRTTISSQSYKVVNNTLISDKPNGLGLRLLFAGEILVPKKIDGEYGLFLTTTDKINGYVYLEDLINNVQDSLTYGISKVDKVVKNETSFFVLAKNEMVAIKDFKDDKFIIVDDKGEEFAINDTDIEVRASKEQVSRSSTSRRTQSITKVITSAYNKIGSPYVYGDIGKRGYDCSGLTYSIFLKELSITLPRSSNDQVNAGTKVAKSDLVPGDLLLFNTSGKGISHVGLYIGEGNMIHASSGKRQVRIDNIDSGYYSQRYVSARRIVK